MNHFPKTPYPARPLTDAERQIPYAKYYDWPLCDIQPHYRQMLAEPMSAAKALPVERLLELLNEEQSEVVIGYCVMEDGTGYNTHYAYLPQVTLDMLKWWYGWLGVKTKGAPAGCGNLKYRIWCPPDHVDYGSATDAEGRSYGFITESFDLGYGDPPTTSNKYRITPQELGLSAERQNELAAKGWAYTFANSVSANQASRINANYMREHPNGGVAMRQCNWCGYMWRDGRPVRDNSKPQATLEGMRKMLIHNSIEIEHLGRILPLIYAEYHDKPADEA